jgi:peptide/nickel transport system substrate-binding protein
MKKRILVLLVAVFVVFGLALYASGKKEVREETVAVTGEPQYGGTLNVNRFWQVKDPATADVTQGGMITEFGTGPVLDFLLMCDFEKYGPRGTNEYDFSCDFFPIVPSKFWTGALAESWEIHPDKVIFHLRKGVVWQAKGKEHVMQSRELTADDIVYSESRHADAAMGEIWAEKGGFVTKIYAQDKYTVVFETSKFNFDWPRYLSSWSAAIIPQEVVEAGLEDWNNLVGTGPFTLKEYVTGSHLAYARNPDFWGKATIDGKEYEVPFVDELVYPLIADESTQLAAIRTGKLDIYLKASTKWEETLKKTSPDLKRHDYLWEGNDTIGLRCDREPFSSKKVRRAMMIGLDIPAINKTVYIKGDPYSFPMRPDHPLYIPMEKRPKSIQELYQHDPEKAKKMLAEAGYPEGFKVTAIVSSGRPDYEEILTMASSYWEKLGVELEIKVYEPVAYQVEHDERRYDIAMDTSTNIFPLGPALRYRKAGIPPLGTVNRANYLNPYFDEQFEKAQSTFDEAARDEIWKELCIIMADEVAYIPIGARYDSIYWWPWVNNYYGEFSSSNRAGSYIEAACWIDQNLKKKMGF